MTQKYNQIEVKDNMNIKTDEEVSTLEKKQLKPVISEAPQKVKKGLITRLVQGVAGPDGVSSIGEYVNEEIIKPAFKNIIVDAVTSGINMLMYGDKGARGGGYRGGGYQPYNTRYHGGGGYSNYNSRSTREPYKEEPRDPRIKSPRQAVEEYILPNRNDAVHVLTALTEQAERYGSVSVADYYDLIQVASEYTDNQWGWTSGNIIRASILPTRGGFVIKFPSVEMI